MKHMKTGVSFAAGFLVSAVIFSMGLPAFAALYSNWIEVYTGVNIYIDDQLLNPVDANGNPVEAFVYNGTTYLPVRAVGEAVGKTVQWEAKTSSVYLGKHTGNKPAVWLKDLDYFTGRGSITAEVLTDNLGHIHSNASGQLFTRTYKINGQYSAITGTLFWQKPKDDKRATSYLSIYGDGELLYTASMGYGMEPLDFNVDLTGILELEVKFTRNYADMHDYYDGSTECAIADLGLWT